MIEKIGGRKVIAFFVVIVVGLLADYLATNGLSDNLLYLLTLAFSAFVGGNGIEHLAKPKAQGITKEMLAAAEENNLQAFQALRQIDAKVTLSNEAAVRLMDTQEAIIPQLNALFKKAGLKGLSSESE